MYCSYGGMLCVDPWTGTEITMFTCEIARECLFAVKECKTFQSQSQVILSLLELGYKITPDTRPDIADAVRLAVGLQQLRSSWTPSKEKTNGLARRVAKLRT